ncbi:MAG: hypothetical protein J5636_02920 [Clostridiales bacterium]|nr:hypothetical protein [Clostridiales bacterium]
MTQTLRNIFIKKPFSAESLNIQGYSIVEISKRKLRKSKIFRNMDFVIDTNHLMDVLENKGKIYGYTKKGQLKALYVVTREGNCFTCDEVLFALDINGEPVTGLMDQQVVFLMAQNASYHKDGRAVFQGTVAPKLVQKTGPFNFFWAVFFAVIYSFVFSNSFSDFSGILIGVMMGICMGFCFRKQTYEYETSVEA